MVIKRETQNHMGGGQSTRREACIKQVADGVAGNHYPRCKIPLGEMTRCEPHNGMQHIPVWERYKCGDYGEQERAGLCYHPGGAKGRCEHEKGGGKCFDRAGLAYEKCHIKYGEGWHEGVQGTCHRTGKDRCDADKGKGNCFDHSSMGYEKCHLKYGEGWHEGVQGKCHRTGKDHCDAKKGKGNCFDDSSMGYEECHLKFGDKWHRGVQGTCHRTGKDRCTAEKGEGSCFETAGIWYENCDLKFGEGWHEGAQGWCNRTGKDRCDAAMGEADACFEEGGAGYEKCERKFGEGYHKGVQGRCYPPNREGFDCNATHCSFGKDIKGLERRGMIDHCPDEYVKRGGMCFYQETPPETIERQEGFRRNVDNVFASNADAN